MKTSRKSAKPLQSSASPLPRFRLRFHPEALEEWHALDNSIRAPLKKLLAKRLEHPHIPGSALHPPLAGCYKIKLQKAGVRLVYEVIDEEVIVYVLAVDRREDGRVYGSAVRRTAD
ncbi:type II toxin-antitoxin system RelE family toxin [Ramlibacter sp.]|uniref:type II toxin-antitoxin system RelE family toxin n=1 Tax=Ramlibacter sp. TaxID=1917967 RepID=UPI003D11CB64